LDALGATITVGKWDAALAHGSSWHSSTVAATHQYFRFSGAKADGRRWRL